MTLVIALLGGFMAATGLACEEDDGIFGVTDLRIADACEDYCNQARACDDELDVDDCISRCENTLDDCMADEQEEAVDDVEACAEESCDDFTACTIGAGLQCSFGI